VHVDDDDDDEASSVEDEIVGSDRLHTSQAFMRRERPSLRAGARPSVEDALPPRELAVRTTMADASQPNQPEEGDRAELEPSQRAFLGA
jgi:hypothetical protein